MYYVTKTYGHDLGLSACFRQHRAKSHCRFLHGYALSFKFTFAAETLDENGWVIDFGGLKPLKAWLCETFDHRLLVAKDDPYRDVLLGLTGAYGVPGDPTQLADALEVEAVGCEAFARMAYAETFKLLPALHETPSGISWAPARVRLVSVEVREHGANSAIFEGAKA